MRTFMNRKFIMAIDQGTSSSRAIVFNERLQIIGLEQIEFTQIYPQPGWVEHDPIEIWETQYRACLNVLKNNHVHPSEIAAIGITNQRETTVIWDRLTGKPLCNAIVWQDKRTSDFCNNLKNDGYSSLIKSKTGLVIDSYFSATKINWIFSHDKHLETRAQNGEICFGTVDSWLIWNLTHGRCHVTDYSNASRTMLFNINSLMWDPELLSVFNVPGSILPQVKSSSEIYGYTDQSLFDSIEIPISGIAGDQQSALFGQACFEMGEAKNTYGTGCFMLMNTGDHPVFSDSGMLTTIAWGIGEKVNYALEGSVFIAGAAIKWLRDGLKLIKNAAETDEIARELDSTEGIYVVPSFSGLGAPFWDMYARGAILGITQGVTDKHIVKATLESIAYRTKDVLDAMSKDSGIELKGLNVDGGASINNYLMQFQADILNTNVIRPEIIETTALGVAQRAGMAVGLWTLDDLKKIDKQERVFLPMMQDFDRKKRYKGWLKAVSHAQGWIDEI
jgi:glycerol kinase